MSLCLNERKRDFMVGNIAVGIVIVDGKAGTEAELTAGEKLTAALEVSQVGADATPHGTTAWSSAGSGAPHLSGAKPTSRRYRAVRQGINLRAEIQPDRSTELPDLPKLLRCPTAAGRGLA